MGAFKQIQCAQFTKDNRCAFPQANVSLISVLSPQISAHVPQSSVLFSPISVRSPPISVHFRFQFWMRKLQTYKSGKEALTRCPTAHADVRPEAELTMPGHTTCKLCLSASRNATNAHSLLKAISVKLPQKCSCPIFRTCTDMSVLSEGPGLLGDPFLRVLKYRKLMHNFPTGFAQACCQGAFGPATQLGLGAFAARIVATGSAPGVGCEMRSVEILTWHRLFLPLDMLELGLFLRCPFLAFGEKRIFQRSIPGCWKSPIQAESGPVGLERVTTNSAVGRHPSQRLLLRRCD